MKVSPSDANSWKLCALACVAMVFLSLIPQFHLWLVRGKEWNGAYVTIQGDEPLYSAYVNALNDGRPRRNAPYAGMDHTSVTPISESTFSIQFIPAYTISSLARIFGASSSTAFIVLIGAAALFASLSVYWFINCVVGDYRIAAAGTVFILCMGGLAGAHGLLGLLFKADLSMPSLPFLRRYQPALAFPLFFLFMTFVWRGLTSERSRARVLALSAGLTMAVLIFSYFYLWTAAAAWLACIGLLWLLLRAEERGKTFSVLIIVTAVAAVALGGFAYLVFQRDPTLDEQQTFAITHAPDLLRITEIFGGLILVAVFWGIRRSQFQLSAPPTILIASLGLLPFAVFNQQMLTGRTMQPYHYQAFVLNYLILAALVITVTLWRRAISNRLLVWIAVLSFSWGLVEVGLPSRVNTVPAAVINDRMVPVLTRLKELAREDGTLASLSTTGKASTIVFSPQLEVTVFQPTWTSHPTLLDMGGLDFGSVTREQRKEYFYMHLYYAKADIHSLRKALQGAPEDPTMNYYARACIFGHERVVPALSDHFRPIQPYEIEQAIEIYQSYANSFTREQALKRPVTYTITPADPAFDFSNIDKWYDRDVGERVGDYVLHRLKLRSSTM